MPTRPPRFALRGLAISVLALLLALSLRPQAGYAQPYEAAIGAMVGGAYAPTALRTGGVSRLNAGGGLASCFFTELMLTDVVSLMPNASLYPLDLGAGSVAVTDLDVNLKFSIPLTGLRIALGLPLGASHAQNNYYPHVGALAQLGLRVVNTLELSAMFTYKRIFQINFQQPIDTIGLFFGFGIYI